MGMKTATSETTRVRRRAAFALALLTARFRGALDRGDQTLADASATKMGGYRRDILNRKAA
jgi:hypothetical protein